MVYALQLMPTYQYAQTGTSATTMPWLGFGIDTRAQCEHLGIAVKLRIDPITYTINMVGF